MPAGDSSQSKEFMKAEKAWTIYCFILEEENGGTLIRALTQDETLRLAKLTNEASSDP